jgi:indolepyruvate ferredoxin oxidoreductase beta subunit
MQKNIILAGVGGQGILSVAYVFDNAALDAGFHFKQAEVHGMAQRGGAVQSNLRYSDQTIHSDLIPEGRCDMVLAVEPLEVMRYWHYLQPDGWVVTSITPYVNIPDYPEMDTLLSDLAAFPNIVMVDAGHLAKAAGNLRAQNMVAVGAASNLLDFTEEQLLKHVEGLFARKGEKIVAVNRKAFKYGRAAAAFFRALVDGGLDTVKAVKLCSKIKPENMAIEHASGWVEKLQNDDALLETILESGSDVDADSSKYDG